jgi:plastocyanin
MPSFFELKNISLVLYGAIIVSVILVVGVTSTVANFAVARAQIQPDPDATSVYDSGQMKLGNNVKHLVIVIPNEGHHGPGEEDEARFIAQPFIPQNATVTPGTQVVWFNGDLGHEHNIVVRDSNGNQLFETGEFTELQASRPITFNNTGEFAYADAVEYEEGFVMTGTIRVVDGKGVTTTPAARFGTVGALMVPSMGIQGIATNIKNAGFGIDSMHNFKDLRGGQSDTGDEQTLVIWTADGMDFEKIGSALKSISEDLPYE